MDCQRRCIAHPIHSLSWRRQLESPPQRSRYISVCDIQNIACIYRAYHDVIHIPFKQTNLFIFVYQ
ncbi:hypothetical protein QJS04_geneDACA024312 [Acorus gramineus]|uniref:Uncharacterized protein n=1 Tax=Acorus gramineus TaxID=55184 RepID=A0AAV9A0G5_ACOGR|nr:hypothetical protein QJS04_geneDACA024312 [Acorus gramineus]